MIHRVNWDLRFAPPAAGGGRGGGGGGEEGGGGGGPGTSSRRRAVADSVARHRDARRARRARHVQGRRSRWTASPTSRRRSRSARDPASAVTLAQHKAREAFVDRGDGPAGGRSRRSRRVSRTRRAAATGRSRDAAAGARAASGRRRGRWTRRRWRARRRSFGRLRAGGPTAASASDRPHQCVRRIGRAHRHARGPDRHHARRAQRSQGRPQRDPGRSEEIRRDSNSDFEVQILIDPVFTFLRIPRMSAGFPVRSRAHRSPTSLESRRAPCGS